MKFTTGFHFQIDLRELWAICLIIGGENESKMEGFYDFCTIT